MIRHDNIADINAAFTRNFHNKILTIDDTSDLNEVNKLPVANEHGYLDNSWLQDYSSYKIIDLGDVTADYMTSLNETEYIVVMTIASPSLNVLLFGASKNTPYHRALVYRFLIFNPNNYTLDWISNVEDSTIIWNTYSETAPTLDPNGTYVEFISTDDGKTWYGNSSARTAYDIVNNYYTKLESDDRFVNAAGDTMTGTLTIEGQHTNGYHRGLIIKGDGQSHSFMVQDTSFTKGTPPSSNITIEGVATFSDVSSGIANGTNGQLGALYNYVTTSNNNSTIMRVHALGTPDDNRENHISVSIDANGNKSTYSFTPETNDRSNNIATTEFVGNHFDTYTKHWLLPDMTSTTNAKILSNDGYDPVWVDYKKLQYVYYPSTSTTAITVPASYRTDAVITEVYRDGVLLTESDDYTLDQSTGRITFKDIIESNEKIIVTTETAVKAHSNSVYDNVTITNSSASTPDVSDNSSKIATTAYVNNLIESLNLESGSGSGSSSGSVPTASPHFTGVPTAPTAAVGSNTNQIATTAFVTNAINEYALNAFDSITITGVSTAPTAPVGSNTEQIANTAFVTRAVNNVIDNAPSSLNTLNKLANAIGNDPSFASTVNTALAGKLNTGITTEGSGNSVTSITEDSSGNVTVHKGLTFSLSSHDHDDDYMAKLTGAIGANDKFIYANSNGTLTASTVSLGSNSKPIYIDSGTIKESTAIVGSNISPIYISNGEFTVSDATVGSTDTPVYLNAGVITSTDKNFSDYLPLTGGSLSGELTLNDGLIINDTDTDTQLVLNSDSIQAVSAGSNSDLYLNEDGGPVHIGSSDIGEVTIENGVITASSFVGNIGGTSERASMDSEGNVITTTYAPLVSPVLTGTPTAPTPSAGDNSSKIATTSYVDSAVASLVNSAPETLDTLQELADALNNDPDFATTIATQISTKLDVNSTNYVKTVSLANQTLTVRTDDGSGNDVDTTYTITYPNFVGSGADAAAGLVPAPSETAGSSSYLCEDGTWSTPPNTEYSAGTGLSLSSSNEFSIDNPLPDPTDNQGRFLTSTGAATEWVDLDALPSQANNSGKFLTTDGTNAYWDNLPTELKISSIHYPNENDTTIILTANQAVPSATNVYAMSVYRDGIYLNSGIDYGYNAETRTLTFTKPFETDEIVSVVFTYRDTEVSPVINVDVDEYEAGDNITFTNNPITNKVIISAGDPLPDQTNNTNKVLVTNGTTASWQHLTNIDIVVTPTTNTSTIDLSEYSNNIDSNGSNLLVFRDGFRQLINRDFTLNDNILIFDLAFVADETVSVLIMNTVVTITDGEQVGY